MINSDGTCKKLHYRLADSIRFNNVGLPKEALSRKYYEKHPKEGIKKLEEPIHFDTLYNVINESEYQSTPSNSILFHFRLFDWLSWPHAGKVLIDDCLKIVKDNQILITNMDCVCIVYGGCGNNEEDKRKTDEFIDTFVEQVKQFNTDIRILNSENTDQDFKYMMTAEYFVPSVGGYSTLAAAVSKNNVLWELSDRYYDEYKSNNEKTHVKMFKEHYLSQKKS